MPRNATFCNIPCHLPRTMCPVSEAMWLTLTLKSKCVTPSHETHDKLLRLFLTTGKTASWVSIRVKMIFFVCIFADRAFNCHIYILAAFLSHWPFNALKQCSFNLISVHWCKKAIFKQSDFQWHTQNPNLWYTVRKIVASIFKYLNII